MKDKEKEFYNNWINNVNSGNKIVYHCNTFEKAERLLKILKDNNVTWRGNDEINESNYRWEYYKQNTCYGLKGIELTNGEIILSGQLEYSNKKYFEEVGYEILEFEL